MGNEHVSYIYLYDHMHENLTCVGKNSEPMVQNIK